MEQLPLVTVVTPVYNQEEFIEETIRSVLAQDYPRLEYIVINDGSTDRTAEIIENFSAMITIIHQRNKGQASTLNAGWGMSKGSYLTYISGDDLLYPSALSDLVKAISNETDDVVCVYPNADLIDENSKIIKSHVCREFNLPEVIVRQECPIGPGALFSKHAFETVGGWRSELILAPDREFWIRLSSVGQIKFVDKTLAGYRLHSQATSFKVTDEATSLEYIHLLDEIYQNRPVSCEVARRKQEAYGWANFLVARNLMRCGEYSASLKYYIRSCQHFPRFRSPRYVLLLFRNAVSKRVHIMLSGIRNLSKR